MELKNTLLEVNEGIAILKINRPKALNALNLEVMKELSFLFTEGIETKGLKGIIITGEGPKSFVAGADIAEFQLLNKEEAFKFAKNGHDIFNKIENCKVPVLAAVNGFALGGGNELAMACHLRICSTNARFGQPEVNLGLIPGYGGTQRLIQYLGKGRSMELLLTGDMIDAEKALEYGLVTHVTQPEDLIKTAKAIIEKIATKGPSSIASIIEMVNAYYDKSSNGFIKECISFSKAIESDESTEGVQAFLEKRKPKFRN